MVNSQSISLDIETWNNQELTEVIAARYFILGNESSRPSSWEVKGANDLSPSDALKLLNKHLQSLGLIGTLSDDVLPVLSIIILPPSINILRPWQQISIWLLMSIFLTIVGSEWLSRYDQSRTIMDFNNMQESLYYFTIPIMISLLFASHLRYWIARRNSVDIGYLIPIIFPILYPAWPFGLVGLLSQKRIDYLPFPNRKKLIIIEMILPVTLFSIGSIFTIIGLFLTSNNPPNIGQSPIVFDSNILIDLFSSIFFSNELGLKLQWLHPIGIAGVGLSTIGWILLLPIPGFSGDRILYSLSGPSQMSSGERQTSLFIFSLIFMIIIFASVEYTPWLFLSAFAAWQRFSPENSIRPFVIDQNIDLEKKFKSKISILLVTILIIGFPGVKPMSNLENYDSGLSIDNWITEIEVSPSEEINFNITLTPEGIMPISGFLQLTIEGSQSELWNVYSDCEGNQICYFSNITQSNNTILQITIKTPEFTLEEKMFLRIVIDIHDNEQEHLILLYNYDYSGPNKVFWEISDDGDKSLICTTINILANDTGNLSISNPFWDFENSTTHEGENKLCLRGHEGAILSSNYTDDQFRRYGPVIEFNRDNDTTLSWWMPIKGTEPKLSLSGTEWQVPPWFNMGGINNSMIYGSANPSFCKSTSALVEINSNWTWLAEEYSPVKLTSESAINGTIIMPSSGWLMICEGIIPVSKYSIVDGLDVVMYPGNIGDKIFVNNFSIFNREEYTMPISVEWYGDFTSTDIWDVDMPNTVDSNDSANITIQVKGDDSLYRVSWITADNNEIIIHLAARCSINGCIN